MQESLFKLPEYRKAFTRFVGIAIQEVMIRRSPVFSRMQVIGAKQVPTIKTTVTSGQFVENPPLEAKTPFAVNFTDTRDGSFDSFLSAVDQAADHLLVEATNHFYAYMSRVCDTAGTRIDAKGKPLSHDLILEAIDRIELDFDDNDNPVLPTFTGHIASLPSATMEQCARFEQIVARKREEYIARQRTRKLS
jgi:hypothetical protein